MRPVPTGQTSTWSESQTRRYDAEWKTLRRERVTFERRSNAAYIYLKDHAEGEAVPQHHVDEPHTRGMIVLDFDKKGSAHRNRGLRRHGRASRGCAAGGGADLTGLSLGVSPDPPRR
jgi:Protein of unknown function (DUF2283)